MTRRLPDLPREALTPYLCPHCGRTIGGDRLNAGVSVNCPHCQQAIRIPAGTSHHGFLLFVILVLLALQLGGCFVQAMITLEQQVP